MHGKLKLYGDDLSQAQSSTWDLEDFTGIEGQSGKIMCQGGKPDTGKFHSSYIGIIYERMVPPMRMGAWSMHMCYGSGFITMHYADITTNLSAIINLLLVMNFYLNRREF